MGNIKAGVVVVTKFCGAGSGRFTSYINYIDRKEAARTENSSKYNLYQDYMGNPDKTTGLFTYGKDELTETDKLQLKRVFEKAQENGSLMWQTVISFDNRWLEKNGLYDAENQILDEESMKSITRNAINGMLKSEGLENAVWSGAIHYNTDNIHVHVATVEPEPMRERREYIQYRYHVVDGKRIHEPQRDGSGNVIKKEEYKGRFRQSSINGCRKSIVNQILHEKENNQQINRIIRGSILEQKQKHPLSSDRKLKHEFIKLYQKMPDCSRNMWNYNNPIMASVKSDIDNLSTHYLNQYHSKEFEEFKERIRVQDQKYQEAYGTTGRSYEEGKMQDLYTRLGNAILKEIRNYDTEQREAAAGKSSREYTKQVAGGVSLASAINRMRKGLKSEWEKARNEQEHERMMQYGADAEKGVTNDL
ncbi:MAG: relaxase MobL [Roseburia sp.]|nr:relaxase MobL [Roseburia sp.]